MIVCVPVAPDGSIDPRWGRAARVAVARLGPSGVERWDELDVGWDRLHDAGPEGQHHARVAAFLREHGVQLVLAGHMGPGMARMLPRMGIAVRLGASGSAREAVAAAGALVHRAPGR